MRTASGARACVRRARGGRRSVVQCAADGPFRTRTGPAWPLAGLVLCLALAAARPAHAQIGSDQQLGATLGNGTADVQPAEVAPPSPLRPIRIAKWSAFSASLGTAAYGFTRQRTADRRYSDLERLCQADAQRCAHRLSNGAFADAELETMYQEVVRMDRTARFSLLASQAALVTSVVLFVLDLRERDAPANVPYEPPLRFGLRTDGGVELAVGVALR